MPWELLSACPGSRGGMLVSQQGSAVLQLTSPTEVDIGATTLKNYSAFPLQVVNSGCTQLSRLTPGTHPREALLH